MKVWHLKVVLSVVVPILKADSMEHFRILSIIGVMLKTT